MNPPVREMSDRLEKKRTCPAFCSGTAVHRRFLSFVGHIRLKTSATLGDTWPDRRPQLEDLRCSTSRLWSDR
jgi:hypothetical protein